ncbi:MAG: PLP-dependent aminotransferase family protein [Polaribacter sp.]|nr:PLP-dependent aminotransferase family protein [Polaribacter sp.]
MFPINQWKNLLNSYWRHVKVSTLSYSRSTGINPLRKEIAQYLKVSRGIKCDYRQIMVVSGSLQSLYLIASVLLNKDDEVILENPTFPNMHSIFKSIRAKLIPINLDKNGIDIQAIKKIQSKKVKLIAVTPTNQYPTSIKMSIDRRVEILQWASNNNSIIIENDFENEIGNYLEKLPTIFSIDNEDRTIYMGTFNRLLHPSIRLGYMILPNYLIDAVEALQEHSHRFVAPSIQLVMSEFIKRNYLYQHLKNIITAAQERRKIFIDEFSKSKTMYIDSKQFNSLHVVAKFKNVTNSKEEKEIISKLKDINISVLSLSKCYIQEPKQQVSFLVILLLENH